MAAKRKGLASSALEAAARAKGGGEGARPDMGRIATTAVNLGADQIRLLRAVAFHRASRDGGRASVSDVVRGLVESHRTELEAEAGPFYTPE